MGRDGLPGLGRLGMGWQPYCPSPWGQRVGLPGAGWIYVALWKDSADPAWKHRCAVSPVCTALTPVTLFLGQGHTHIWQRARPGCAAGAALSRAGRPLGGWQTWVMPAPGHHSHSPAAHSHPYCSPQPCLPTLHPAGSWPCLVSYFQLAE